MPKIGVKLFFEMQTKDFLQCLQIMFRGFYPEIIVVTHALEWNRSGQTQYNCCITINQGDL